jgi:hypothetical protein
MERQLTVTVPHVRGEEGLSIACREGKLFRNDHELEDLYKEGYRIYNYDVEDVDDNRDGGATRVRVILKK